MSAETSGAWAVMVACGTGRPLLSTISWRIASQLAKPAAGGPHTGVLRFSRPVGDGAAPALGARATEVRRAATAPAAARKGRRMGGNTGSPDGSGPVSARTW